MLNPNANQIKWDITGIFCKYCFLFIYTSDVSVPLQLPAEYKGYTSHPYILLTVQYLLYTAQARVFDYEVEHTTET